MYFSGNEYHSDLVDISDCVSDDLQDNRDNREMTAIANI
jgi:hypothetical protein